ncbi:MAG: tetratricopeptide repeat protein [Pseudomonadota bacterium]
MFHRTLTALALSATLFLSACADAEEKAEEFYQSGLALLEEGDPDRAAIEFRNAIQQVEDHQGARLALAALLDDQGDPAGAYAQYRYVSEIAPDLAGPFQNMARIAIANQNWEEAERTGRRAIELAPDDALTQSIRVSLAYRQAVVDDAPAERQALAQEALQLLEADPTDLLSRRIVIVDAMSTNRPSSALPYIDGAIAQVPEDLRYHIIKLQALEALQEDDEIEKHLRQMYGQFPENRDVQQSLITFYLQRQNIDEAEAFLRELAGADTAETAGFVTVLRFLEQARGRDAAKAELDRLIAANADQPENLQFYRSLRAGNTFEEGQTEAAITEMQSIVDGAAPSDQTRRIKGALAEMLLRTGNRVGGRALIEEIIAEDATNVTALKLRARLLIDGDQPREAILDLRQALDQSPRDTEILLLLAQAHGRNGSPELQGERLATAVEVSNAGVQESLLYAEFLLREDRTAAARNVLADARNAHPTNLDILAQSAQLALADNALGLVRGIIADVERLQDQPRAPELLQSLRTALLLREDRVDEGLAILQQQAGTEGQNAQAVSNVVRTQLQAGRVDEARAYLDTILEANPDDPALRMINAALHVAEGDVDTSEEILRDIVAKTPDFEPAATQLYVQLARSGKPEDARAVLTAALDANPNAGRLLLFQAGELERDGDIEGAIAIYETLYTQNTNNVVVANNLASLLSTFRDDADSQARAAAVARRLRGTEVPAFQDTYGWIAYQQGDFEEALTYLEPAAAALTDNPLAQYHLGMTYAALERPEEARDALMRALEIAGPDSALPQMQTAQETLDSLQEN